MKPRTLLAFVALSALAAAQTPTGSLSLAGRETKTFPAKKATAYDGDKMLDGDFRGVIEVTLETDAGTVALRLPKKRTSCSLYYSFSADEGRGSASWRLGPPKPDTEKDFPFYTWDSESAEFDEEGRGTGTASYKVSGDKISGTFKLRACRRRSATKVERYDIKGEFKDVAL